MTFSLKNTLFCISLFTAQACIIAGEKAHKEAFSMILEGVRFKAKALSGQDNLTTFYRNLHEDRIFPMRISIENTTKKPLILLPEEIVVDQAKIITPKTLENEISASKNATALMMILLFPIGLACAYRTAQLEKLQPIINQFSITDEPIIIQPGQTFETMLFPEFDRPKDIDGKIQKFIAPNDMNIAITLKQQGVLFLHSPVTLKGNVNVPTDLPKKTPNPKPFIIKSVWKLW